MLKTERLVLRPPVARDAESITRYANNRKVWLALRDRFPHPYHLAHARQFIASISEEKPALTFGIDLDGEVIGVIGVVPKLDIFRHSAEIGYWLGEPFWGRGLATEAVRAIVDYSFDRLDLTRLFAWVFDTNRSSVRVLEKAGFRAEGTMRRGALKDGQLIDTHLYAKLKGE